MKKLFCKNNRKKVISTMVVLCMIVGLMPMTVSAAGYGDKGYDTTNESTYIIDGNDLFTYVTGNGGTIERISGGDNESTQQYRASAFDNWEFAYWSTYYVGPSTELSNPVATLNYYYFSKPGDKYTAYDKTNPVIQVNEEVWAAGTFYLQAIFKPKVTISVNRDLAVTSFAIRGTSSANNGLDNVGISGKAGYVPYDGKVEVFITGFKDYVVQSVSVFDGFTRDDFTYEVDETDARYNVLKVVCNNITRPTNFNINVKIKEQIVSFDANGGNGVMTAQTFESGTEKPLQANAFEKAGYSFDGWNTAIDGSGTAYSDKQAVIFAPANDGNEVTLYAQWKKVSTEHSIKLDTESFTGGSVSVDKDSAKEGDVVTVTVTVEEDYKLVEVAVFGDDGTIYGNITEIEDVFVMPDCPVTLEATFEALPNDGGEEPGTPAGPEEPNEPDSKDKSEKSTKTGDDRNFVIWIAFMLASGCAGITTIVINRKRKA